MATLPRGVLEISRKNKDGTTTVKYRVRVVRKDFKADQVFDDLEEAKEFLALSKVKKGKEIIYKISEEERAKNKAQQLQEADQNNYSFGYFIDRYINEYVTHGKTKEEIKALPELDRRNIGNKLSFFNTIRNTSIIDKTITYQDREAWNLDPDTPIPRFMEGFDIRKIGVIQINDYIRERLKKGLAKQSVSREVTYISNIFRKLQYFNEELANLDNPALKHDKDLLVEKNKTKRKITLTTEEQEKLLSELANKNNKEMVKIATISILTSLRRAEIITLRKGQIHEMLSCTEN